MIELFLKHADLIAKYPPGTQVTIEYVIPERAVVEDYTEAGIRLCCAHSNRIYIRWSTGLTSSGTIVTPLENQDA